MSCGPQLVPGSGEAPDLGIGGTSVLHAFLVRLVVPVGVRRVRGDGLSAGRGCCSVPAVASSGCSVSRWFSARAVARSAFSRSARARRGGGGCLRAGGRGGG